jgi:fructokinase
MTLRIVGIGEVLWDLLPEGAQLGGAPTNFTCHAAALGAQAAIISRVGADSLGDEIRATLGTRDVATECIQIDVRYPTGTVEVDVDAKGQPTFEIRRDCAWDYLQAEPIAHRTLAIADAVCFGTLAQRSETSHAAIIELITQAPIESLRIFDINLRQQYYSQALIEHSLSMASVLKLNDTELPAIAAMLGLSGDVRAQIDQLCQRWQLRAVAYTRGAHGSILRTEHEWSDHPGIPVRVQDTVGAGDAFTAAMTIGLLRGWALDDVNRHANHVASFVASSTGATPMLPESIRAQFTHSH